MRYEIKITAAGLMLNKVQAKELLVGIDSLSGLGSIQLLTGHWYDSEIEKEGSDSEDPHTSITFYLNGEEEIVSGTAHEVLDRITEMHEIRENGLFFTVTDVNNIEQYG